MPFNQVCKRQEREREKNLRSHLNERIEKKEGEEKKAHLLSLIFVVVGIIFKFIVSSIKEEFTE
jgi:hypothetical protein